MQHRLVAGMVKWHECPLPPRCCLANVTVESQPVGRDAIDRHQGGASECRDDRGAHQVQLRAQVARAVGQLPERRCAVAAGRITRVTEDRVGDENVASGQAGAGQQAFKVPSRTVLAEGNAGSLGTEPPRCLGDEEHDGVEWSIQIAQNAAPTLHRRTEAAGDHALDQAGKSTAARRAREPAASVRCRHNVIVSHNAVIDPSSIVGMVAPAWVLVVLIGAFWTGAAAVLKPPRGDQFARILIVAIIGATIGQLAGWPLSRPTLQLGDVHLLAVSLGAVLALGIVRHFSP